jgi:hypothetical protein
MRWSPAFDAPLLRERVPPIGLSSSARAPDSASARHRTVARPPRQSPDAEPCGRFVRPISLSEARTIIERYERHHAAVVHYVRLPARFAIALVSAWALSRRPAASMQASTLLVKARLSDIISVDPKRPFGTTLNMSKGLGRVEREILRNIRWQERRARRWLKRQGRQGEPLNIRVNVWGVARDLYGDEGWSHCFSPPRSQRVAVARAMHSFAAKHPDYVLTGIGGRGREPLELIRRDEVAATRE